MIANRLLRLITSYLDLPPFDLTGLRTGEPIIKTSREVLGVVSVIIPIYRWVKNLVKLAG